MWRPLLACRRQRGTPWRESCFTWQREPPLSVMLGPHSSIDILMGKEDGWEEKKILLIDLFSVITVLPVKTFDSFILVFFVDLASQQECKQCLATRKRVCYDCLLLVKVKSRKMLINLFIKVIYDILMMDAYM